MKNIEYKIHINAPKQKVWETMLQPDTYKEWVAASWPGSFYEGEWKKDEKIRFVSKDGSGTLALIEAFKPYDYISAKHIAMLLQGGKEDYSSDVAKGWIGTMESYTFNERNGETDLTVEMIINPEWQKMFDDGWPNALKKLKEICE
jgi:uncharacterized protein YndB with AHSA1/START domain